jgi:limonene-1,2-epoxide hydrolase
VDHVSTVETFFKRWSVSFEEFCQTFTDTFTEDAVWLAAPLVPETTGPDEAIALLRHFQVGFNMATVRVEMLRIGQTDDVVWTERLDHITDPDGNVIVSIPVAGVLTLNDAGKITSYRDYWDMQELNGKALG